MMGRSPIEEEKWVTRGVEIEEEGTCESGAPRSDSDRRRARLLPDGRPWLAQLGGAPVGGRGGIHPGIFSGGESGGRGLQSGRGGSRGRH